MFHYLCFCIVRVFSTNTCSSECKGFSMALGLGPWWTSLHTALSATVKGQGSESIGSKVNKSLTNYYTAPFQISRSKFILVLQCSHICSNFNKLHTSHDFGANLDQVQQRVLSTVHRFQETHLHF